MNQPLILLFLFSISIYPVQGYTSNEVTAFVAPDSSFDALSDTIDSARETIYINVYTFTSLSVLDILKEAEARGVEVYVIVEKSPVGGMPDDEKALLGTLADSGADIFVWDHPDLRFNHAKYMVVDNKTLLVTTENLGITAFPEEPTGGNRGWGIVVDDAGISGHFAELFFSDIRYSKRFAGAGGTLEPQKPARGYKQLFDDKEFSGYFEVYPVVAPIDAIDSIVTLVDSATDSVFVEQLYAYKYWGKSKTGSVDSTPNLFLEAILRAARRGCDVKIILDSTWYNVERDNPRSNYYTVEYLNQVARDEGLDLEARLFDADARDLTKLHAKVAIVDSKTVLVSSVNWNEHSPTNNRETGVILHGEAPAEYFIQVFEYDWEGKRPQRKYYIFLIIPPAAALAVVAARKRKGP
jgi:phosphatidylserine/phosphatidylglycerophosphate/cardiolipin synthase-like enzyme